MLFRKELKMKKEQQINKVDSSSRNSISERVAKTQAKNPNMNARKGSKTTAIFKRFNEAPIKVPQRFLPGVPRAELRFNAPNDQGVLLRFLVNCVGKTDEAVGEITKRK